MRGMDYRRLREALRALRFEKKLGVPELATDAGLNKTTVYRLEDVDTEPDRELDLVTLEKLTTAMGLTLSEFFARIEGLPAQPFGDRSSHGADTALSSATHVPESLFIAGLQNLALTIDRAVDRLIAARTPARRARKQTATPRARTAVRDGRHRKVG